MTWMLLSDGTSAADMTANAVGPWERCGIGSPVSYQFSWPVGTVGMLGLQFTNEFNPGLRATPTDFLIDDGSTQPTGAEENTILYVDRAIGNYVRPTWTVGVGTNIGPILVFPAFGGVNGNGSVWRR